MRKWRWATGPVALCGLRTGLCVCPLVGRRLVAPSVGEAVAALVVLAPRAEADKPPLALCGTGTASGTGPWRMDGTDGGDQEEEDEDE